MHSFFPANHKARHNSQRQNALVSEAWKDNLGKERQRNVAGKLIACQVNVRAWRRVAQIAGMPTRGYRKRQVTCHLTAPLGSSSSWQR